MFSVRTVVSRRIFSSSSSISRTSIPCLNRRYTTRPTNEKKDVVVGKEINNSDNLNSVSNSGSVSSSASTSVERNRSEVVDEQQQQQQQHGVAFNSPNVYGRDYGNGNGNGNVNDGIGTLEDVESKSTRKQLELDQLQLEHESESPAQNKNETQTQTQTSSSFTLPSYSTTKSSTFTSTSTSNNNSNSNSSPGSNNSEKPESWNALSTYDLEIVKQRIREWTDQAAIVLRERADGFTNQTKTRFSKLGSELNKVTGYEEIEALKREVVAQEEKIQMTRQAAKQAKIAYEEAVIQRSNSQREVNELLQRKSIWTDNDVGRFTSIVRQDHLYEQEEARAKAAVDETEAAVEKEFSSLMKVILARYHEEQVWSDKIRSASTYGSLAALGLNLLVFILAIVIVEPWKRKRLAQTFETKIEQLSVENAKRLEESMKEIGGLVVKQDNLLSEILDEVSRVKEDVAVKEERPIEVRTVEIPVMVESPPSTYTIPGIVTFPQYTFHLAAVGVGAFVLGMISTILLE